MLITMKVKEWMIQPRSSTLSLIIFVLKLVLSLLSARFEKVDPNINLLIPTLHFLLQRRSIKSFEKFSSIQLTIVMCLPQKNYYGKYNGRRGNNSKNTNIPSEVVVGKRVYGHHYPKYEFRNFSKD